MKRLNRYHIDRLLAGVATPSYDYRSCGRGILHFGIGAFHRAHQAMYTDMAMGVNGGNWKIIGVSLRNPSVKKRLAPQDYLYTIAEIKEPSPNYRLIGSVDEVIFAPADGDYILRCMADTNIRIISLTVTEKGYHQNPATHALQWEDPEICHDLEGGKIPQTAIGYLVKGLAARRKKGLAPFTIMSCDNLPENGDTLRKVVLEFASLINDKLTSWIEREVSFPCSMVDRIVPPTTEADISKAELYLGIRDEALIVSEPFCQWVIEDEFPEGRPAWDQVGVIFSSEVILFEKMKLRLLNGAHSTLAYLGYLAGKKTIVDCMQWPELKKLIQVLLVKEVSPTLSNLQGFNVADYIDALLQRFSNPGLNHSTWHIAMDGSQKIPQRLLHTIQEQLSFSGESQIDILCLAVAGWMRYVCGKDELGVAINVEDPLVSLLTLQTESFATQPEVVVNNLLGIKEIFGSELPANLSFKTKVEEAFCSLSSIGVQKTVINWLHKYEGVN